MDWTTEQRQIIDLRDENMLVSAAAGSGKTTVLVERILSRVTDPVRPIDIDRLLVVTFTRAAAAEMKSRIGKALADRLDKDPANTHLQKQAALVDHAQISTIHGFCTTVVQNFFYKIDLDPTYRIGEENELTLLKGKVLTELLEEAFTNPEEHPAFLPFMRSYGSARDDRTVRNMILQIYEDAISDTDPEDWFEKSLEAYHPTTEEELNASEWMQRLLKESHEIVQDLIQATDQLIRFVENSPVAPQKYLSALYSDLEQLEDIVDAKDYDTYSTALHSIEFAKLSSGKSEGEDPDVRADVKARRDAIKEETERIRDKIFGMPVESVLEELQVVRPHAEELIRLVRLFKERFDAEKRRQNLIDFSDLEHFSLRILTEKQDDGSRVPTEAARELASRFEEVMIDEYQDSNYLQEEILRSVSGKNEDIRNRFMVGDVKQSIYGFRKARPDLFLEKYDAWEKPDADGVRIDLHQNFRSREEVLNAANAVFSKLMIPAMGGISYDDAAALHVGATYPPAEPASFAESEMYILNKKDVRTFGGEGTLPQIEAEAYVIAKRIRALREEGSLWDGKQEIFRPVELRDCVILLRGLKDWGDVFVRVLQDEGIPAYSVEAKGYFDAPEIRTMLDYLRICDNPRQDIPLATVLRSPIVGLEDHELSSIRIADKKVTLYDALWKCAEENGGAGAGSPGPGTAEKIREFLTTLEYFRGKKAYTPVHELLREILKRTRYEEIAAAMPAGAQRRANLELLLEYAVKHTQEREFGVFSFLRYIDDLEESKIDLAKASLHSEEENIVRVMTVHRSKGLEFPIVFLAGIGKGFNRQDERSSVVMHEKFGIGMAAVYPEERRRRLHTLLHDAVVNEIRKDNMAEELRILYVAMTRAKEKLILIGTEDKNTKSVIHMDPTYQQIRGASTYMEWIRMAVNDDAVIREIPVDAQEIAFREVSDRARSMDAVRRARKVFTEGEPGSYAPDVHALIAKEKSRHGDTEGSAGYPAKITVSELKHAVGEFTEFEYGEELYPRLDDARDKKGRFIGDDVSSAPAQGDRRGEPRESIGGTALRGAARGTAYHHVFATFDFASFTGKEPTEEGIRQELDRLLQKGILSEEEREAVREEDVRLFLMSLLGRRMIAAAVKGTLRREQPFVLDLPISKVFPHAHGSSPVHDPGSNEEDASGKENTILIQGTIDAYWEEDGAYVLMDYKTDRVGEGGAQALAERYRIQLDYYTKALTTITGKAVREAWIYSVELGKEIPV